MRRLRFILGDAVLSFGGAITSAALRLYPDDVVPPDEREPFFGDLDSPLADLTDAEWAGLMVLHAEAVHGCDHTEMARAGVGMAGPRGKAIAS